MITATSFLLAAANAAPTALLTTFLLKNSKMVLIVGTALLVVVLALIVWLVIKSIRQSKRLASDEEHTPINGQPSQKDTDDAVLYKAFDEIIDRPSLPETDTAPPSQEPVPKRAIARPPVLKEQKVQATNAEPQPKSASNAPSDDTKTEPAAEKVSSNDVLSLIDELKP